MLSVVETGHDKNSTVTVDLRRQKKKKKKVLDFRKGRGNRATNELYILDIPGDFLSEKLWRIGLLLPFYFSFVKYHFHFGSLHMVGFAFGSVLGSDLCTLAFQDVTLIPGVKRHIPLT